MISAVVLLKNEAENIEKCLTSLLWCDEIIVVDDYSTDKTIELVHKVLKVHKVHKVYKVLQRKLKGDFAAQRNFGLEKATGDWVLFIDADEIVTRELQHEIKTKIFPQSGIHDAVVTHKFVNSIGTNLKTGSISGFYLKRRDWFLGRWLKFGETSNVKLLRLARKNAGRWQGRVHETWEVKGKVGELKNPILHYPHQTIAIFLKDINWYTDVVAQYWLEEGKRVKIWEIIFYPLGKFLQNYISRLGILDGIPGLIMAFMMSFHSFLVRGKVWLSQHKNG